MVRRVVVRTDLNGHIAKMRGGLPIRLPLFGLRTSQGPLVRSVIVSLLHFMPLKEVRTLHGPGGSLPPKSPDGGHTVDSSQ